MCTEQYLIMTDLILIINSFKHTIQFAPQDLQNVAGNARAFSCKESW